MAFEPELAQRSIDIAARNVADGERPFGAVIAREGRIVAEAANVALRAHNPTAHAEMLAIELASAHSRSESLDGCVLYASCEPCVMCAAAIRWAKLSRVYYCLPREAAEGFGFPRRRPGEHDPRAARRHRRARTARLSRTCAFTVRTLVESLPGGIGREVTHAGSVRSTKTHAGVRCPNAYLYSADLAIADQVIGRSPG